MATAQVQSPLKPGVIYTTRAAYQAAEHYLSELQAQIQAIIAESGSLAFGPGDVEPDSLQAVVDFRNLSTQAEDLSYALYSMGIIYVDDLKHGRRAIVMPGTEVFARMGGEPKSWIVLGPLDLRDRVHEPEVSSRMLSYLGPIAQPILGLSAGDTTVIPALPGGRKNILIEVTKVKPWPPQATKKRSKALA